MNSANQANKIRQLAVWCAIFVVHLALLQYGFRTVPTNNTNKRFSTLVLRIVRPPVTSAVRHEEPEKAHKTQVKQQAQIKPQETPAKIEEQPAPNNIAKTEIDPFAITPPPAGKFEGNDRAIGQIWKELEKEYPVRRNLNPKAFESNMQRFARQVLAASTAREMTMEESVRADGTKMTKVTTPHGVFCVVGPVAGRIHDIRGPEKRVMACPIEF